MIRRFLDAFNFAQDESTTTTPAEAPNDVINEDGWVAFDMQRVTAEPREDEFAVVESPEIVEMGDEENAPPPTTTRQLVPRGKQCPEAEAVKRREALSLAKAKTASRNHLESVMFADPISGKDVRLMKTTRGATRTTAGATNAVRRVNSQQGTQRSKKSSGKSNDRKTHRASEMAELADV